MTFRFKYKKGDLDFNRMDLEKNHATVLLAFPEFISTLDFNITVKSRFCSKLTNHNFCVEFRFHQLQNKLKFPRIGESEGRRSYSSPKAKLKGFITYDPIREVYSTFMQIDEEWIYFSHKDIQMLRSYSKVVQTMIDNLHFPVLAMYQRAKENTVLENDADAYQLIEENYSKKLSKSELNESGKSLITRSNHRGTETVRRSSRFEEEEKLLPSETSSGNF